MLSKRRERERILLVGGFHKTMALAKSLRKKGCHVTAINQSYEDCEKLAEIQGLKVLCGDGCSRFVLEDAAAADCRVVIALTGCDETNLVICEMCKSYFGIPKTVSLLNDPAKSDFFYRMGVSRVICALNLVAGVMEEQAIMDRMMGMIPLEDGRVQVAEVPVLSGSALAGRCLRELDLPRELVIGCVLRDGESLIPRGDTRIAAGDVLVVITTDCTRLDVLSGS